jgi:DNA repair protein RadC
MNQFTFEFVDEQDTTARQATAAIGDHASRVEFAMAVSERPQNRLENFGASALSDTELLAMALQGSGMRPELALQLAARLIVSAGSVAGLLSWKSEDYRRVKGIGPVKASQLAATAELARRMMIRSQPVAPLLNRADLVAAHLAPIVAGLEIEKFWVLCLTRKNRLLKQVEITSGTATAALAHPREVYRAAIRASATGIICAHNHPSGDPAPSAPDMQVTRQLREAAKAVDIELLDHVIVGRSEADPLSRGYFSFREAGIL